jgi:hypothetical protein
MADTEGKVLCSPSTSDRMDITTTYAACFNLDVDVPIFEGLEFVLEGVSNPIQGAGNHPLRVSESQSRCQHYRSGSPQLPLGKA